MGDRLTLAECGDKRILLSLPPGRYQLEYNDSTHLQANEWTRLGYIDLSEIPSALGSEGSEQFFYFEPALAAASGATALKEGDLRALADTLALALGRLGLLTPSIEPELMHDLLALEHEDGIVIVPDTNALHNGAVHWFLSVLRRPSVWLLPVVASLTTIQTRDAMVKALVNKRSSGKLAQALRSRGLVNGALGLLQRNRGRCQVVEVDPSLLRYQKLASNTGADPDQSDVLEDRLIIEAIHGVLRSMRSRTARRVVTSDVNIARVLHAEGIETLFIPTILLGPEPIPSVRFDALARSFVGAPLRALLWELTHVFSSTRLRRDDDVVVQFDCHWPAKTPAQWSKETLVYTAPQIKHANAGTAGAPPPQGDEDDTSEKNAGEPIVDHIAASEPSDITTDRSDAGPTQLDHLERAPSEERAPKALREDRKAKQPEAAVRPLEGQTAKTKPPSEIRTPLPRGSFPQALRLLGSLRRVGPCDASTIVEGLSEDKIGVESARRALEILRRARLLDQNAGIYRTTPDAEIVDAALRMGDLDTVSALMERFDPYSLFLRYLRDQGSIPKADVVTVVKSLVGDVGSFESERLPRFHTLLGQAWTQGDRIIDGSRRPTDRDAADAFEEAFAATSSVGIASVADLIPRYCEATRMSPWMAKRRIEKFVADRLLPAYTFQPAAGSKPITRDEIVTGNLDGIEVQPVVVDRLHLGQRPVFTIEGPSK